MHTVQNEIAGGRGALVVFIHGFMSGPRRFDSMAGAVRRMGYPVRVVQLPGHGAGLRDFSASRADMWVSHVFSELREQSKNYETIYIIAHSMGGLIALNAAARFPQIRAVFLLACPFILKLVSGQAVKVRLMQAFYPKKHPMKAAYIEAIGVPIRPALLWRSVGPGLQVGRLISATRHILPKVNAPVTAVYSKGDELVSPESLDVLRGGLVNAPLDAIMLEESLHSYYPDGEAGLIYGALRRMLT